MAALTQDRNTQKSAAQDIDLPAAAATKFYGGAIVAIDTGTGYAKPGATATTLRGIGTAKEQIDNSAGANGDVVVPTTREPAWLDNSGTDPVSLKDIGTDCYIVDDHTVAKTDGAAGEDPATRSVAGIVANVDEYLGVLVKFV